MTKEWKKNMLVVIVILLISMVVMVSATVIFSPGKIPFPYEPNQIVGKKLGGVQISSKGLSVCDNDSKCPS